MGKPKGRNGWEPISQRGRGASFKFNMGAFRTGVHRSLVVARPAALAGERDRLGRWLESLAVASRPLQRRLAETNFEFGFRPLM
jgi:hypothetical protein